MTDKTGGQAFPQPLAVGPNDDMYPAYPGMTLRDYFAGQALAGILSGGIEPLGRQAINTGVHPSQIAAVAAYEYASAMLLARQKESQ